MSMDPKAVERSIEAMEQMKLQIEQGINDLKSGTKRGHFFFTCCQDEINGERLTGLTACSGPPELIAEMIIGLIDQSQKRPEIAIAMMQKMSAKIFEDQEDVPEGAIIN